MIRTLLLCLSLTGCVGLSQFSGNADYVYTEYSPTSGKKTCRLRIMSGREAAGIRLQACPGLQVEAVEIKQGDSILGAAEALEAIFTGKLLSKPFTKPESKERK